MENPYKYTDIDPEEEREEVPEEVSIWHNTIHFFGPLTMLILTPSAPIVVHEIIYKIDNTYLFCLFAYIILVWPVCLITIFKYLRKR